MKKKEQVKSLRSYHAIVVVIALITMAFLIMADDWSDWITWLPIAVAIFLDGKFEKKDELSQQNMAKANAATMWTLIAALLLLYMDGRFNAVPAHCYLVIISGAVALRSGLFLIFDRTPNNTEEDE